MKLRQNVFISIKWSNTMAYYLLFLIKTTRFLTFQNLNQMAHLSSPWPPQPPSSRAVACAVHPPSWHLLLHSPLHNGTFLGSHCPIPLWGSLTESQEYNESLVFVVIQGYSLSLISYVIDQMMSILVLKLSSVQLLIKMIYIWILLFN